MVVNINPLERDSIPKTPQQIQNRINEVSFNSSLLRELRAIEFVQRLLDDGTIPQGAMSKVNIHMIADDALMEQLSVATKTTPNPAVIASLKKAGIDAATGSSSLVSTCSIRSSKSVCPSGLGMPDG